MIYTVTLNPAVDYVINAGVLTPGSVNRALSEQIFFGGKGINVSLVLKELGVDSAALGFTAGFTGEAIVRSLEKKGIKSGFVSLADGFSRINVKIRQGGGITEINGSGPDIPESAVNEFFGKLDALSDGDFLVLAGSVPRSLPPDIYERILSKTADKKINSVVDASGELLQNTLKFRPFLIKPNIFELSEIVGKTLQTESEIIESAKDLQERGAVNVLVSMGADGAILVDESGAVHKRAACKGVVKNTVGAGDSMVAGFIAGIGKGCDYALKLATACGGATAFSDGLADLKAITDLMD